MKVLALVSALTLLLPIIGYAYAQEGTIDRTVTMQITNTKTGSVKTKVWNITSWTFGDRPIDVSDVLLKKIERIYNTKSFRFTLQNNFFEAEWLHFEVRIAGTPLVGTGLDIKFV